MVRSSIDPIRPGASLILAWQIKHKHVLIIGGGFVAAGRLVNVLEADAKVTVVCPDTEELSETVRQHLLDHPETTRLVPREFLDSDLTTPFGEHHHTTISYTSEHEAALIRDNDSIRDNTPELCDSAYSSSPPPASTLAGSAFSTPAVDMVLSAIDDIPLSTHIYNQCKRLRIPVNIADVPPQCDFYFCSTHRDQSLQVAVSTSGKGPKLANLVRRHIADHLPNRVGDAIEQVGKLRVKLRKLAPGPEVGPKRMTWMSRVCESWRMEDLATLDEQSIDFVLEGFKDNKVFTFEEIQTKIQSLAQEKDEEAGVAAPEAENEDLTALNETSKKTGRLILVGAGPGDPELLTRKAACLQKPIWSLLIA
ncbi:Bifunctional dehydrogenase and ferrochelatase [Podila horticola]|nr:Bifunctional dehydrogenase and ferrochelatase [Podila horticola]